MFKLFPFNKIQKMPSKESDILDVVTQQETTISLLRDQITYLKDEVSLLRISILEQRREFEEEIVKQKKHFEKMLSDQKEYFNDGVKLILLTLETERLNNEHLIHEVQTLRENNHSLLLELNYYKSHPQPQ